MAQELTGLGWRRRSSPLLRNDEEIAFAVLELRVGAPRLFLGWTVELHSARAPLRQIRADSRRSPSARPMQNHVETARNQFAALPCLPRELTPGAGKCPSLDRFH